MNVPMFHGLIALFWSTTATTAPADDAEFRGLLAEKCSGCHVDGGVAFSFGDLDQTYAIRQALVNAILAKRMPPWMAESGHQSYRDDFSLTADELTTVERWRDAGFPRSARKISSAQVAQSRFRAEIEIPLPATRGYLPDQDRRDDYRCFVAHWPLAEDRYVTGIGLKPGNVRISHHAILYVIDPSVAEHFSNFLQEEGGSYQCFGGPLPDRLGDPQVREQMEKAHPGILDALNRGQFWLAHWAPGMEGYRLPADTGVKIKAGSLLVVQMHYYSGFAPDQQDAGTVAGFTVATNVRKPAIVWPASRGDWLNARTNQSLVVPPRARATVTTDPNLGGIDLYIAGIAGRDVNEFESLELHSVNVHMHLIGAAGQVDLIDPAGATTTLLKIPRYQFSWQRDFFLQKPVKIPLAELAEHRVRVECTFANPHAEPVYGGYGSDEEMCYNFSYLALAPKTKRQSEAGP